MDVGLLNEAVMRVWGWRAGCPAASWASLCCGGLIESTEEAHFRVIYYHPNTSCLLCCCAPCLAPSWGESPPFLKLSESPLFLLNIGWNTFNASASPTSPSLAVGPASRHLGTRAWPFPWSCTRGLQLRRLRPVWTRWPSPGLLGAHDAQHSRVL